MKQALLRTIAEAGGHITTGFIGNKYILPVLTAMGNQTLALVQTSSRQPCKAHQAPPAARTTASMACRPTLMRGGAGRRSVAL